MVTPSGLVNRCRVSFRAEAVSEDYNPDGFKRLALTVTHPEMGQLAEANILIVDPRRGQDLYFFTALNDVCGELGELATEVFNSRGFFKDVLTSNDFLKGTGCWGYELDWGMIVHIMDMNVKEDARGMGVGSLALEKLLKSKYVRRGDVVTAWPMAVPNPEGLAEEAPVLRFFRKNGFRRIARTHFFGYSSDPEHLSHRVAINDDVGYLLDDVGDQEEHADTIEDCNRLSRLTDQFTEIPEGFDFPAEYCRGQNRRRERFPAHHVIVDYRERRPPTSKPLLDALLELYTRDPLLVRKVDEDGLTPLHIAAQMSYADGIRALLAIPTAATGDRKTTKRGTVYEDLKRFDNIQGRTPEDLCKADAWRTEELQEMENEFGIGIPQSPTASELDREAECTDILSKALRELETESQ